MWQTGSGTQTNMNVNEVIANRAIQLLGGELGSKAPVHPNDHVNMVAVQQRHVPDRRCTWRRGRGHRERAARRGRPADAIDEKRAERWRDVVKLGRTHLQDAMPLTVGQEWSGWAAQLATRSPSSSAPLPGCAAGLGGTAVGTGLNSPAGFGGRVAAQDRRADR